MSSGLLQELGKAYYESHMDDHQTEMEEHLAPIRAAYAEGSWLECTEEEIANGPFPELNLKFYRSAKPICALLARTPTKGDVVNGILTEEQFKTYFITNLVSTGVGIALVIVLMVIV